MIIRGPARLTNWNGKKHGRAPDSARLQEFLNKNIKEEIMGKLLPAEGIGRSTEREITTRCDRYGD